MPIERWAVPALRTFLVVLFAVLLLLEVMSLPGQFAHMAQESPDQAHLRWPLTMVKSDRIFTPASLVWVDVIIWAIGAGWLTFLGVFLYVGFHATDPGMPLLMFLLLTGGAVLGSLMVVMRALLRQATTLRTDMDAVI